MHRHLVAQKMLTNPCGEKLFSETESISDPCLNLNRKAEVTKYLIHLIHGLRLDVTLRWGDYSRVLQYVSIGRFTANVC